DRSVGEEQLVCRLGQLFDPAAAGRAAFEMVKGERPHVSGKHIEGQLVDHIGHLGARELAHWRSPNGRARLMWLSTRRARTLRKPRRIRVFAVPSGMFSKRLISSAV